MGDCPGKFSERISEQGIMSGGIFGVQLSGESPGKYPWGFSRVNVRSGCPRDVQKKCSRSDCRGESPGKS